jgi:hypothetical protein
VAKEAAGLDLKTLPGLVLDDAAAKLTGKWTAGTGLPNFYGSSYRYRGAKETGAARFEFPITKAGRYEVRMAFQPHENRGTNVPVTIETAEGRKTATINQRVTAPLPNGFASLGVFRFEPGQPAAVIVGDGPADGNVHIDVVQLLPVP